ncbi:transcriptional regulator FtrA [Caenispirillum bisanense]|uniref:transcriptional regulator FtrA n=1 Tax=Caenispirillum bisanense TaxID=414052 RepID=UPI0031D520DC
MFVKIMPIAPPASLPADARRRRVVALAYDGLCTFEFGIVVEVFGLPRPEVGPDWYSFAVAAADPGPLRATGGVRVMADGGLDLLATAGTIVIPGWRDREERPPAALLHALRAAHAGGARLVSICSGVFVLAAAGLLDGRRATTHWRHVPILARDYPAVRAEPDVLYVDEGDVLTSAGSAAGIDLCLHVVRKDFGPRIANMVARRLVVPPHREGGQAQFIDRPVQARAEGRFAAVLAWLGDELPVGVSIDAMAARAGLSRRTFLRRFQAATGTTPGDWLTARRVARARDLLETTALAMEDLAAACGFGSAATLRHHFRLRVGVSPTDYRRAFAGGSSAVRAAG